MLFLDVLLSELVAGDELGLGNDELNSVDALDITATDSRTDDSTDILDTNAIAELFSDITALSTATLTESVDESDSVFLSDNSPNLLAISLSGNSGVVVDEDIGDADVGDDEDGDSDCLDRCFSLSNLELGFDFNFSPLLILFFFLTEELDEDEDDC